MDLTAVEAVLQPRTRDDLPGWRAGDAFLAGGSWLFSEPQPALRRLVDLAALAWPAINVDADGIEIAATCRIAELHAWNPPPEWPAAQLIPRCCDALLGSFKVWNVATVGGNICLALPAGPMTALAVALDGEGTVWTANGGERRLKIVDLVVGDRRTSLREGEILRSIRLPAAHLARRSAFRQISLSPVGRSAALLAGTIGVDGRFALTLTAATPRPVRFDFDHVPALAELNSAIETEVTRRNLWFDDVHGAPDWRHAVSLRLAEEIRSELAPAGSCA